ncbi:MAG: hypothetical protein HETSPECPRED_010095 [Heterodermia speciosa]|uniref:Uncharacterized protein n=1 Tax=Heterodermia speciosa TaxID=116794 RepID=A0A8H3ERX7_9LECA|nr:MAG: hypothetical protein HETSPECPRED_010095 [Heterodermia speciosa]
MSVSLKLLKEIILQIINVVHPDGILNLSLTCKLIWSLARGTVQRHRSRKETRSCILLYGCHRHQDRTHPLTLIVEICKDPNVAHYPRNLIVECCGQFAGLHGDEIQEYDDNYSTVEDEVDGGEGKRSLPMYYSADTIEPVIQGMREGVRGHTIGLLLVLLPNIQWIYLKEYPKGANAFAQAVQMIVQSYSMNKMPNPKTELVSSAVKVYQGTPNPSIRARKSWTTTTITLSATRDSSDGSSVSDKVSFRTSAIPCDHKPPYTEGEPPVPAISTNNSLSPPPFSSLYFPAVHGPDRGEASVTEPDSSPPPAFCPAPPVQPISNPATTNVEAETKAALPSDTKGQSSGRALEDAEPPPPYTEGSSPLDSFTYVMAAAGGPASLITQVQQGGGVGRPGSTLADVSPDEHITLDLRGTRFTLSRDELLTLPEFVLLSLFPNGLLPDGHTNSFHDDVCPVDYDPASLQYMLEFFRNVAQTIPSSSPSPAASPVDTPTTSAAPGDSARDMLYERAGIIVLREDLDFYAIPPKAEIDQPEMIEVKRAAGRALLGQDGIFSGLRRSEETGTTEQHLIEMLTAGGFHNDDRWGHRAGEPNKAVICSLALARLRTDIRGNDLANSNAVGMAQKLLLFWRKPARRCWWEGVELDNVDGVEGKLKVWIRRVWTLEMSVIGLR